MDAGYKSKRLYPSYTLEQLYQFAERAHKNGLDAEKFQLAIRQRESFSPDYVPQFVVPQLY
jgi:hypothetical protein